MILGMSLRTFTYLHVYISLIAIGAGFIVVYGMIAARRLPLLTNIFLFMTALTSLTGFLFPFKGVTPAIVLGILSLIVLVVAIIAGAAGRRLARHLCDLGYPGPLLQFLCSDRAVVPENPQPACAGVRHNRSCPSNSRNL